MRPSPLQRSPSPLPQTHCKLCLRPTLHLSWWRTLKHNSTNDQLIWLFKLICRKKRKSEARLQEEIEKLFLPPRRGKRTYLTKERTPLFWMLPGSQKAFFSFFFTSSLESRRSIFDSWKQKQIIKWRWTECWENFPSKSWTPITSFHDKLSLYDLTSSEELILAPVSPGTIGFIRWARLA